MPKTVDDYVDDATTAAINALGLNPETCPNLWDSLHAWLSWIAPRYITDDAELGEENE